MAYTDRGDSAWTWQSRSGWNSVQAHASMAHLKSFRLLETRAPSIAVKCAWLTSIGDSTIHDVRSPAIRGLISCVASSHRILRSGKFYFWIVHDAAVFSFCCERRFVSVSLCDHETTFNSSARNRQCHNEIPTWPRRNANATNNKMQIMLKQRQ